jgi:hypothetical protein
VPDHDAGRGHADAELIGDDSQVLDDRAEVAAVRLLTIQPVARNVQAEHGHALLVEAACDARHSRTCVTSAELVSHQRNRSRVSVWHIKPRHQLISA